MGLLMLGLGGFGAVNLSGNIRSIGTVGGKTISMQAYARQIQNEIRALEQQSGQSMPFARAQEIGLDRAVLQRLVRNRAQDHEADVLGLSIGDEALREEILKIAAFKGVNGEFDREGYRFALQQSGISEAEFETSLREEASRTLLQGAIIGGVRMPAAYADTLVGYLTEQRSFTWTRLDETNLNAPVPTPTDDDLNSYYEANIDLFMLPDSKEITYAQLSPDDLIDEVEVPEAEIQAEYDARADEFNKPERRLVERLVFADQDAADSAAAMLEVNGTTFNALVQERGLQLSDVDLGDVGRLELDAAGEAVFAAETGAVVGPLPSDLGPALFRVNAVLPAHNTTLAEATPDLRQELALTRAIRAVEARAQDLDDQLAGGATLEQLAQDTKMTLGTINWSQDSSEGIAAYGEFRQAAAALDEGAFPKIQQLEDGGIYAMRLDAAVAAHPAPFEDVRADVLDSWTREQTVRQLTTQASTLVATLGGDASFEAEGFDAIIEENQTRNAFIDGTPDGFMDEVFKMTIGNVTVLPAADSVVIVRLDGITPAGDSDQAKALATQISAQLNQTLAQDLYTIYADDVVRRAGTHIDQAALQAVHVNFP